MLNHEFSLTELTRLDDALLPAWLDLYETAFLPAERLLVSFYLRLLAEKDRSDHPSHHLLAAVNRRGELGSIMHYRTNESNRMASLWYLAVHPDLRGRGLGSEMYRALLQRLDTSTTDLLLFEVEIPAEQKIPAYRLLAQRRIGFYQRMGAQRLEGIDYLQVVGPHQAPIPMHLMVHLLRDLSPQQVFDRAKDEFGDCLTLVGDLSLVPPKSA